MVAWVSILGRIVWKAERRASGGALIGAISLDRESP
jgi:hypothetical protein